MRNRLVCMISTVAAVVLTASHASHADDQIDLATWDQSRAYAGILVTEFLDWSVHGRAGHEIGKVESLYVDRGGEVTKIIVESDGALRLRSRMRSDLEIRDPIECRRVASTPQNQ